MSRPRLPDGPELTLEALSQQVSAPRQDVLGFALLGSLGNVRAHEGTLLLRPTERQLDLAFPDYARHRVAKKFGWPLEDTVGLRWVRREYGDTAASKAATTPAPDGGPGLILDSRGWGYVRLSSVERSSSASPLTLLLRKASATIRDLQRSLWFPERAAVARTHLSWDDLAKIGVPTLVGRNSRRHPKRYAWLGASSLAMIERASLETAVRMLGQVGLSADDFVPRRAAITHLTERFGMPSERRWINAAKAGHIIEVRAAGFASDRHQKSLTFSHVPHDVWDAKDPRLVKGWLEGLGASERHLVLARPTRRSTLQQAKGVRT